MKTQTLFRLGALATILTAIGYAVGELIYMIGGTTSVDTLNYEWFSIVVAVVQVFAVIALFIAQAERGNIFTFIGFVLLILGLIFYLMDSMGELGLMTGAVLQEHLDQVGPITSFIVIGAVAYWSYNLGLIIFGYGTFRAEVFPRWAGILLLLAGVTIIIRDIRGVEYIFAILLLSHGVGWGGLYGEIQHPEGWIVDSICDHAHQSSPSRASSARAPLLTRTIGIMG